MSDMGDGNPKYKDLPRPESVAFFERSIPKHKKVSLLRKIETQKYEINRTSKSDLNVYLTNLYIVGIADVHEIISKFPEVNCIVTISNWNSYSKDAKTFCISQSIGLFKYSEFYGALYHDNEEFYNYTHSEKDD